MFGGRKVPDRNRRTVKPHDLVGAALLAASVGTVLPGVSLAVCDEGAATRTRLGVDQ